MGNYLVNTSHKTLQHTWYQHFHQLCRSIRFKSQWHKRVAHIWPNLQWPELKQKSAKYLCIHKTLRSKYSYIPIHDPAIPQGIYCIIKIDLFSIPYAKTCTVFFAYKKCDDPSISMLTYMHEGALVFREWRSLQLFQMSEVIEMQESQTLQAVAPNVVRQHINQCSGVFIMFTALWSYWYDNAWVWYRTFWSNVSNWRILWWYIMECSLK